MRKVQYDDTGLMLMKPVYPCCLCVFVMMLVFADEASESVYACVLCVMGLVFADEALVSVSLQTFPHYQRRDNRTALEGERDSRWPEERERLFFR